MKSYLLLLLISSSLFLVSCETTKEISVNADNSGTIVSTTDMSGIIGMAKMSGQGKDLEKASDKAIDTVVSLSTLADSLKDITPEDRVIISKGKLGIQMNLKDEKCLFKIELPFKDLAQIARLDKLTSQFMMQGLKKIMQGAVEADGENNPFKDMGNGGPESSIDDYFTTTYSKGLIEKKLIKEKYATIADDKELSSLKEVSSMGIGKNTVVINLPKPAIKAEGKNITLSDDKKKVTIKSSMEDFFDDATTMEFRIEY